MPDRRHTSSRRRSSRRASRRTSRTGRYVGIGVGVFVLLVLAWMGREALNARSALTDAASQAKELQQQITDGDSTAATATLAALQDSTSRARSSTDGPLWGLASVVPFVGDNVDAVQIASRSLDDIAQQGLPPIVKVSGSLSSDVFKPSGGRFDLDALRELEPSVSAASAVLTDNRAAIADIDADDLLGPLKAPMKDLQDKIGDAEFAASSAARAMRLVPPMLGGEGKRTYLLLFQNNAEIRASGGLPGAFAILTADDGRISFGRQGSTSVDVPPFDGPVVKLGKEEKAVFGETIATDMRNANVTPDFTRTATITREMIKRTFGTTVDGVLSLDPVSLQLLLKGTGPIEVAGGTTLTADNAVDILLNDVYARFADPRLQDAFFADSAKRIFDAVTSGRGDARVTLEHLVKASEQRRILLWSADPDEEKVLAATRLGGTLSGKDATRPEVGLYLNDITQAKLQYYLDSHATMRSVRCDDDGVQTLQLTATFTSNAPADAKNLPRYILGGSGQAPDGVMVLDTRFLGPAGGKFTSFTVNNKVRPINGVQYDGRPVNFGAFRLKPGETARIEATILTGPDARADAELLTTPGVRTTRSAVRVDSTC